MIKPHINAYSVGTSCFTISCTLWEDRRLNIGRLCKYWHNRTLPSSRESGYEASFVFDLPPLGGITDNCIFGHLQFESILMTLHLEIKWMHAQLASILMFIVECLYCTL